MDSSDERGVRRPADGPTVTRRQAMAGVGAALLGGTRPRQTAPTTFDVDPDPVGGLAADDRYLYVVQGTTPEPTLGKFSLRTGDRVDRFELPNRGQSLAGVAAGGPRLWTTDYQENDVYKIDPETGEARRILSVTYQPTGVCDAGDAVWIADATFNELRRYDRDGSELESFGVEEHTQAPGGLGYHDGDLWLGDGEGSLSDGGVYRFATDGTLVDSESLDFPVPGAAGTAGGLLTADGKGRVVYRVGQPAVEPTATETATATAGPTDTATGTATSTATSTSASDLPIPGPGDIDGPVVDVPALPDVPFPLAVGGVVAAAVLGVAAYVVARPKTTRTRRSPGTTESVTIGGGASRPEPGPGAGDDGDGVADGDSTDGPDAGAGRADGTDGATGAGDEGGDAGGASTYEAIERGDRLGGGVTGDVYRATTDASLFDDGPVALKQREVAAEGSDREELAGWFERELSDWGRIDDHENVLDLLDWGTEPVFWFLMEYADEGAVRDRLGEPSVAEAVRIGVGAAAGLHHAHEAGVRHFALDPSSILLRSAPTGQSPVPKVGDWALAGSMLGGTELVASKGLHYVAPEQIDSEEFGEADERTDVYRLGAVLYHLVTGTQPPQGEEGTVMYDVIDRDPRPPSEAAPDRDVPDDLGEALTTALATRMADRYPDMAAFRDALSDVDAAAGSDRP